MDMQIIKRADVLRVWKAEGTNSWNLGYRIDNDEKRILKICFPMGLGVSRDFYIKYENGINTWMMDK